MNPDGKSSQDQAEQRRRAFADGQAVSQQEYTAELVESTVEAQKKSFNALMNGLDFVERFDASDPIRARLIDSYRQGMLRLGAALTQAEGRPQGPVEETLNSPFFVSSTNSSSSSTPPSNPSKVLESAVQGEVPSSPEPPKRGPGRPPGRKNNLKTGGD